MKDPPASSYPACIAFKCVQLQSIEYAEHYLRLLREACMLHGINIARQGELTELARSLKLFCPEFNLSVFIQDLTNGSGKEAFRSDMQNVKNNNINRLPCLIFRRRNTASIIIPGTRPYSVLSDVIKQMFPGIEKEKEVLSADAYRSNWPSITKREMEEALIK